MSSPRQALTILLLAAAMVACAQPATRSEFGLQSNGLIYSDSTMKVLTYIVDSLNLRFKHCDLNRVYYSCPQGRLWKIEFASKTNDLKELRLDLDKGLAIEDLLKKYRAVVKQVDTGLWVIAHQYEDDKGLHTRYLSGTPAIGYESLYTRENAPLSPGKWVYEFTAKGKYLEEYSVDAYQIPSPLQRTSIPAEYAQDIQYVDCMIDTNAVIFKAKRGNGIFPWFDYKLPVECRRLNHYLNGKMSVRKKDSFAYNYLTRTKFDYADSCLHRDDAFRSLLQSTIDSCIADSVGNSTLEEFAAAFISNKAALELKRRRIVMGQCSQDMSPREHAFEIAKLAAETHSWDIFLRTHLDIMNDRFERMTDGSYAWHNRKTYLKELEELDLDVIDLVLGLSLRADGLSTNHYNGTVWRLGWAMSESKNQPAFEDKLKNMLKDDRLDPFNRGLLFILLYSYIDHLDNVRAANDKIDQLQQDAASYPPFLRSAIMQMEQRKTNTDG